jgi:hypothetical protein
LRQKSPHKRNILGISLANIDIGGALNGLGAFAKNIREAITGKGILDPNKQAELLAEAQRIELSLLKTQTDINLIEATSRKLFVAGWRPFVGWVCGAGFAWAYVVGPMFYWISDLLGHPTPIPTLDLGELVPLLLGMLGLAGYRTFEKTKNTEGNR